MPHDEESTFVRHVPCGPCSSRDNASLYSDGHVYCHVCGTYTHADGESATPPPRSKMAGDLITEGLEYEALGKRKITEETCRLWGYQTGRYRGKPVQVANHKDGKKRVVAQKLRLPGKDFRVLGDSKEMGLYGKWLWPPGGKKIVVTEGEIDAMSMSQVQGNKWPVVSIPNGAHNAADAFRKDIEYLESFGEVIIMFDNDEAGEENAVEAAEVLSPGKAKIAKLPLKDAGEMLVAGRVEELVNAMWRATPFRPDGVVAGSDIEFDDLWESPTVGYLTQYPELNDMLGGIRKGELTLFCAGSGVGKSTICREITHHFVTEYGLKFGNVFLEENYRKTAQGFIAIDNNVPLGKLRQDPNAIAEELRRSSYERLLQSDLLHFYNHFGSLESDALLAKLRYFAVGLKCDFIVLDHISMAVAGADGTGDERKDIDVLMERLRSLVENTGVGVLAVNHLKKKQGQGKSHEEGGRVTLDDLRGSGGLKQMSDNVVAIERDQQTPNNTVAQLRLLKNREWGTVGPAGYVNYDTPTGRLLPIDEAEVKAADDFPEDMEL